MRRRRSPSLCSASPGERHLRSTKAAYHPRMNCSICASLKSGSAYTPRAGSGHWARHRAVSARDTLHVLHRIGGQTVAAGVQIASDEAPDVAGTGRFVAGRELFGEAAQDDADGQQGAVCPGLAQFRQLVAVTLPSLGERQQNARAEGCRCPVCRARSARDARPAPPGRKPPVPRALRLSRPAGGPVRATANA